MKTAFLFPGQGAQHVGMGKDVYDAFAAARGVFDEAEDIAHLPIKKLCFEGPQDELDRTDNAQPAIFTHSAAMLATMAGLLDPDKAAAIKPAFVAGLSLGEYTAIFAAGCIGFADALKLVTLRGSAMQKAASAAKSGMVAVMGIDEAKANELCKAVLGADAEGLTLSCANFNAPGQIVLSGDIEACKRAEALAKDFGASGAVPLGVAGAFHSRFMATAADELGRAIDSVAFVAARNVPPADPKSRAGAALAQQFATGRVEVMSNVEARPYGCMCRSKHLLMTQLTGAVRWQQCVEYMLARGVERFYEIGPGRVLSGLMRRIDRKAKVVALSGRESLEKLAAEME